MKPTKLEREVAELVRGDGYELPEPYEAATRIIELVRAHDRKRRKKKIRRGVDFPIESSDGRFVVTWTSLDADSATFVWIDRETGEEREQDFCWMSDQGRMLVMPSAVRKRMDTYPPEDQTPRTLLLK